MMIFAHYYHLIVNYSIYSHSYHYFLLITYILLHLLLILFYAEIYRSLLIFASSMTINNQIIHLHYLTIRQNQSIHNYHHQTSPHQTHNLNHSHQTHHQTNQLTKHKVIINLSFIYPMPSSHSSLFIINLLQISIVTSQKTSINVPNFVTIQRLYLPYSNLY